jgi:hypothetical protein
MTTIADKVLLHEIGVNIKHAPMSNSKQSQRSETLCSNQGTEDSKLTYVEPLFASDPNRGSQSEHLDLTTTSSSENQLEEEERLLTKSWHSNERSTARIETKIKAWKMGSGRGVGEGRLTRSHEFRGRSQSGTCTTTHAGKWRKESRESLCAEERRAHNYLDTPFHEPTESDLLTGLDARPISKIFFQPFLNLSKKLVQIRSDFLWLVVDFAKSKSKTHYHPYIYPSPLIIIIIMSRRKS